MPVAKDQTMFEMETCACHNEPGVLVECHNGAYRWRCSVIGGTSWVTVDSQMDVYNALVCIAEDYSDE